MAKSELVYVGGVEEIGAFRCRMASLHMKYLDLPLMASCEAKSIWDGIVENLGLYICMQMEETKPNGKNHF